MDQTEKYQIPNLKKACEILKILANHPEGLTFKMIREKSAVPHTTLIRIIKTLQAQHFIADEGIDGFRLGSELHRMGGLSLRNLDVREEAAPIMKELADTTRATSHLATLAGDKSLIVAVEDSPERIQAAPEIGSLADLHSSSTGKCFLAHAFEDPEAVLESLTLEPQTPHSLTDIDAILEEINITRKRGYSIDDEEHSLGVRCCSAPVFDNMGEAVASIGITAPEMTFPPEKDSKIAQHVKKAARRLSARLGHTI